MVSTMMAEALLLYDAITPEMAVVVVLSQAPGSFKVSELHSCQHIVQFAYK